MAPTAPPTTPTAPLPHLRAATLDLCHALHAWVGFERAAGGWGDAEFAVVLGREAVFGESPPPWPAPRRVRLAFADPSDVAPDEDLTAHARLRRAALFEGAVASWRAWERQLARDVPALWPALALPKFTLSFDGDSHAFSAVRLHFLKWKTNLGGKHEESKAMPFAVFADRIVGLVAPLAPLPKATALWALNGPRYSDGPHKRLSFKDPVMAGAGPAEAAFAVATLNIPVRGPDMPTLVERILADGYAQLPSKGALDRARRAAQAFVQPTSAGGV